METVPDLVLLRILNRLPPRDLRSFSEASVRVRHLLDNIADAHLRRMWVTCLTRDECTDLLLDPEAHGFPGYTNALKDAHAALAGHRDLTQDFTPRAMDLMAPLRRAGDQAILRRAPLCPDASERRSLDLARKVHSMLRQRLNAFRLDAQELWWVRNIIGAMPGQCMSDVVRERYFLAVHRLCEIDWLLSDRRCLHGTLPWLKARVTSVLERESERRRERFNHFRTSLARRAQRAMA